MREQAIETIGVSTPATATRTRLGKHFKSAATTAAAIILAVCAAGVAVAADPNAPSPTTNTQNVNVVNTPTVTVGSLPPVSLSGTPTVTIGNSPTVTIGGSSIVLPTKDLSTFASVNVSLQARAPAAAGVSATGAQLNALSSTGVPSSFFGVPGGQTLVVTSIDISPVTPGPGTNQINVFGSLGGAAPALFRRFIVSNAISTHLDYPTGIAFGSTERLLILNGQVDLLNPVVSAGDVDIYLQGYLTSN